MRGIPLHRKVLALLGIAALLLQLEAVPFEGFLFHLNKRYISRNLCEHKVPNCNGHCFLMKQMAGATSAAKDKNSERLGGQLDGHFLPSALNPLTLSPSSANYFTAPSPNLAAGWRLIPLEPPRLG